jgi:hypothetical protein
LKNEIDDRQSGSTHADHADEPSGKQRDKTDGSREEIVLKGAPGEHEVKFPRCPPQSNKKNTDNSNQPTNHFHVIPRISKYKASGFALSHLFARYLPIPGFNTLDPVNVKGGIVASVQQEIGQRPRCQGDQIVGFQFQCPGGVADGIVIPIEVVVVASPIHKGVHIVREKFILIGRCVHFRLPLSFALKRRS